VWVALYVRGSAGELLVRAYEGCTVRANGSEIVLGIALVGVRRLVEGIARKLLLPELELSSVKSHGPLSVETANRGWLPPRICHPPSYE